MKATIRGQQYEFDLDNLLDLNELVHMKREIGIGMKTFIEGIMHLTDTSDDEIPAALDSIEGLNALRALVWAIQLRAGIVSVDGKPLTVERANAGINLVEFMESIDAPEQSPDPTGADEAPQS